MICKFKPQTVILLIGPSGCGKTHLTKNCLIPGLISEYEKFGVKPNIQHLSSDGIRRELLGHHFNKTEPQMLSVSKLAFELLYKKLEFLTSYPINAENVIIDTTGLNEEFRQKIVDIARDNNYLVDVVLFVYKDRDDYYKFIKGGDDVTDNRIVSSGIKRLNQDVLPALSRRSFNNIHKVKSIDFGDFQVEVEDVGKYSQTFINSTNTIIGDVHGCYDELIELLSTCETEKVTLVGDYIDKGPKVGEVIEYLYANREKFILVTGNHENFVYKYLHGEIKDSNLTEDFIREYFSSIELFNNNQDLKRKFFELHESSVPFLKGDNYIVTHAPCSIKYLGKLHYKSLSKQRNCIVKRDSEFASFDSYVENLGEELKFLKEDNHGSYPLHIFGHLPINISLKTKAAIDGGCVDGGKLVAIVPNKFGKPFIKSIKSKNTSDFTVPRLFSSTEVDLSEIDPKMYRKLVRYANDKINYISGTMCPADKTDTELESLEKALEYFATKSVEWISLQPKYMGSRLQIYLRSDGKHYSASRNGFVADKQIKLDKVYENVYKNLSFLMTDDVEMVILDGELLPWRALGAGLIEESFYPVLFGAKKELGLLQENGFFELHNTLMQNYLSSDFRKDSNSLNKKSLIDKYKSAYQNYSCLWQKIPNPREIEKQLIDFNTQMEYYGVDYEPYFSPFDILKIVYKNGDEKIPNQGATYTFNSLKTSDLMQAVSIPVNDIKTAKEYYSYIVGFNMEGIVIKPEFYKAGIAPYIKVRNPNYLKLVYGFDYDSEIKYQKLLKQKGINNKLRLSISEYKIGRKMLEIPHKDISKTNKEYMNLVASFVLEEQKAESIDPRL